MKVSSFEKGVLIFNLDASSNVSCLDRKDNVFHLMVFGLNTSHSSSEEKEKT